MLSASGPVPSPFSIIEIQMDSLQNGFSWWDMAANAIDQVFIARNGERTTPPG
jgi:hypothetical protein